MYNVIIEQICEFSPAVTRLTVYRRPQVRACFNRDVLAIHLSDRRENLSDPSSHIKESFPRSSGHSTSRIQSSVEEQVWSGEVGHHSFIFEHFTDTRGMIGWHQERLGGSGKDVESRGRMAWTQGMLGCVRECSGGRGISWELSEFHQR